MTVIKPKGMVSYDEMIQNHKLSEYSENIESSDNQKEDDLND